MQMDEDTGVGELHSRRMDLLRVLLVDDHTMVAEALAARLSAAPDLWVAGRCATGDPNLADIVRRARPDVVAIEVEPLGAAIGEVLERIAAVRPGVRLVVLSADRNVSHAVDAARAGADAWVPKEVGADEFEAVVRAVCRGHSWYPPEMLGEILRELRADVGRIREYQDPLDVLSPRERDVLASMVEGRRGREIAEDLMISTDTVRTHTRSIFTKLGVHSRLEAVSVARNAGLWPPEQSGAAPRFPLRGSSRPDKADPGTKPAAAPPGGTLPRAAQRGGTLPRAAQPRAAQPRAAQTGGALPRAAQTGGMRPRAAQPGGSPCGGTPAVASLTVEPELLGG
jgi:two-component system, NarL family, response regulator LiaR